MCSPSVHSFPSFPFVVSHVFCDRIYLALAFFFLRRHVHRSNNPRKNRHRYFRPRSKGFVNLHHMVVGLKYADVKHQQRCREREEAEALMDRRRESMMDLKEKEEEHHMHVTSHPPHLFLDAEEVLWALNSVSQNRAAPGDLIEVRYLRKYLLVRRRRRWAAMRISYSDRSFFLGAFRGLSLDLSSLFRSNQTLGSRESFFLMAAAPRTRS